MKKLFQEYYKPSEAEFDALWRDCFFTPDASVLLSFYRYKANTRDDLLQIFAAVQDRLWLSHQAAFEYFENRLSVIKTQFDAYEKVINQLNASKVELASKLTQFSRHSLIDIDEINRSVAQVYSSLEKKVSDIRDKHPNYLEDDSILGALTDIFDGRVGKPYDPEQLQKIYRDIDNRYENRIPPGFADDGKRGTRKYGDAIIWFQIIEEAKSKSKPVILIIDDVKSDWWEHLGRLRMGPQPSLRREMVNMAGQGLYLYTSDRFVEFYSENMGKSPNTETLTDIRETRERSASAWARQQLSRRRRSTDPRILRRRIMQKRDLVAGLVIKLNDLRVERERLDTLNLPEQVRERALDKNKVSEDYFSYRIRDEHRAIHTLLERLRSVTIPEIGNEEQELDEEIEQELEEEIEKEEDATH